MSIAPDATGRDTVESLLAYSLTKPGAWPDQPWEDDVVAKVGGKIFAFFGAARSPERGTSGGAERDRTGGAARSPERGTGGAARSPERGTSGGAERDQAGVGAERDQESCAGLFTVGVKCGHSRDDADEWLLRFPADAGVMPYLGRSGWNTLTLGVLIPDDELRLAVDESYAMVVAKLPRRLRPE